MARVDKSLEPSVDEFYFSALFDSDEIFPISDEKYALELSLQEALVSGASRPPKTLKMEVKQENHYFTTTPNIHRPKIFKPKQVKLEPGLNSSTTTNTTTLCVICMDVKTTRDMFTNDKCSHSFCSDCVAEYVAAKIQDNALATVRYPEPKCGIVLEPQMFSSIVPKPVFDRWERALSESVVMGSKSLSCPFKDCSVVMVMDGVSSVTVSECPSCHRLFCARCEIPWHEGTECSAFRAKEAESLTAELAQKKNRRRCPGCEIYIEKNEGCLHITCRCGNEFCYSCGTKWTSGHSCSI